MTLLLLCGDLLAIAVSAENKDESLMVRILTDLAREKLKSLKGKLVLKMFLFPQCTCGFECCTKAGLTGMNARTALYKISESVPLNIFLPVVFCPF